MFLRIVAEMEVEIYRNLIMKGEARCVGFGSYWLGASGQLYRRCDRASTAGCGFGKGMLKAEGGLRKCKAEERSCSTE